MNDLNQNIRINQAADIEPEQNNSGKERRMSNLRFKTVLRVDHMRHFRLFRIMWERGTVGDGSGYSAKLAVGLLPRLYRYERSWKHDRSITLLGLRIHYRRSYGGVFV